MWGDASWEARYGRAPTAEDAPAERVRTHLARVLERLEAADVAGLAPEVRARRGAALAALRDYAAVGAYPRNLDAPFVRPELVDAEGAPGAVGAMVAATAGREEAEAIDAEFDRDGVWALDDPRGAAWAADFGFTALDLASIQPAYPPQWSHPR